MRVDRAGWEQTDHGAGVEHNGDDLGPSQLCLHRHVRLHQVVNRNESPAVRRGLGRRGFRAVAENGDAPLVEGAGPDLVVRGDEFLATALVRAVLHLHGLPKVEVRPAPCGQQGLANATPKGTGKRARITDSGGDPLVEVLDGPDVHRNHLKLGGRRAAGRRVVVQQVVRLL